MKSKDKIVLTINNLKNNNKIKTTFIIIIICSLISFISLSIYININSYIQDSQLKLLDFRKLMVFKKDGNSADDLEDILNINHVIMSYNGMYDSFYGKININNVKGNITLLSYTDSYKYKNFNNKNFKINKGEMICPKELFLYDDYGNNIDKIFNIYDYIGSSVLLTYFDYVEQDGIYKENNKYNKEFKIVDYYDPSLLMNNNNSCYITFDDIIDLRGHEKYFGTMASTVIVDEYKNVEYVVNELYKKGYDVMNTISFDNTIYIVNFICLLSTIISISLSSTLLIVFFRKKIINDKYNMAILKTFGYSKRDIRFIFGLEFIIILFSALICSILIFVLINIIIKLLFADFLTSNYFNLFISPIIYLFSFVTLFLIPYIFTKCYLYNLLNKDISVLLKEDL